jgi:hypothetical protein
MDFRWIGTISPNARCQGRHTISLQAGLGADSIINHKSSIINAKGPWHLSLWANGMMGRTRVGARASAARVWSKCGGGWRRLLVGRASPLVHSEFQHG